MQYKALSAVGELPRVTRSSSGRKKGKWGGHATEAQELRDVASRTPDPDKWWGRIAERVNEAKAQSIISAIKKGETVDFKHVDGVYEVQSRKSPDQSNAPINPKTGSPRTLYDVWARFMPEEKS